MNSISQPNSVVSWPSDLKANRGMSYRSLELLYNETKHETFGFELALVIACARSDLTYDPKDPIGVVHKLEVTALPDVDQAKMAITHEVCPGLREPTEIVTINDKLKAVGFSSGSVVPVSNFGPKKTFNCDVRGRHDHHTGEITCMAANSAGTQLATACSSGNVALFQIREAEVDLLTDSSESRLGHITAISYFKPSPKFAYGRETMGYQDDRILLCSSIDGKIALLDSRCKLAERIYHELMSQIEPKLNITSLTTMSSKSDDIIYLGSSEGDIIACDLRQSNQVIYKQRLETDGYVERLKEVVIEDNSGLQKAFLAYTNSSDTLQILDLETMKPHESWICKRSPNEVIRDFVQIDNQRLMTCGDKTSIGCWTWDKSTKTAA